MPTSPEIDHRIEQAWTDNRAHLVNLAYRMLGDIGAAEDIVQEAFARLLRTAPGEIDDERAWLIVVTSRLCLDQIRSARVRLDRPQASDEVEAWAVDAPRPSADPADRVTLDDNVRLALHVVLSRLSPAERVVFVLHDVFQLPFEVIGETVGRSTASCRQLAVRARQRIVDESGGRNLDVDLVQQHRVTEAFITSCTNGDLAGLMAILDPDVSGDADFGDLIPVTRRGEGAEFVARNLIRYWSGRGTLVAHPDTDDPVVLVFIDRRLFATIDLDLVDGLVRTIHVLGDPLQIETIEASLRAP